MRSVQSTMSRMNLSLEDGVGRMLSREASEGLDEEGRGWDLRVRLENMVLAWAGVEVGLRYE